MNYASIAREIFTCLCMSIASAAAFSAVSSAIIGLLGIVLGTCCAFGAAYITGCAINVGEKGIVGAVKRVRLMAAAIRVNKRAAHREMQQNAMDAQTNVYEFGAA